MAKPPKPPPHQGRSNFLKEQEKVRHGDAAVSARAEQVKRSLRRLRSGKPASPPRRDAIRDERIAEGVVAALRAGHRVRLTARTGQGVTDYRSRKRRIKTPAGTTQDITFWTGVHSRGVKGGCG